MWSSLGGGFKKGYELHKKASTLCKSVKETGEKSGDSPPE